MESFVCYSEGFEVLQDFLCSTPTEEIPKTKEMSADSDAPSGETETTSTNGAAAPKLVVETEGFSTRQASSWAPLASCNPRQSINSNIEGKIGCCLDQFRCQHNNFTGILYLGPLGVVFLGRFLLFDWTVFIKWEEVTKVRRKASTPTALDNTNMVIRIETTTATENDGLPKEGIYDFEGFFDAEKALESMIGLHNDSVIDSKDSRKIMISKRGSVIPLKRSNSDPAKRMSNIFSFDETPILISQHNNENPNQTTMLDLRNQYSSKNKEALQKIAAANAAAASPTSVDAPEEEDKIEEKAPATEEELKAEWDTLCSELEKYPAKPVRDKVLNLDGDTETFVDKFVGDKAPHSWCKFMTAIIGDSDVTADEWKQVSNSDSAAKILERTIEYTHPVNAPMAPPTARARKEQTLRRYGFGLVLETKTVVSDVPMTDCFYVKDILQLRKDKNKWLVNIRFEVVFVKSTYFKSLITKTTTSEFDKFMNNLATWLSDHCTSSGGDPPTDDPEAQKEEKAPEPIKVVQEVPTSTSTSNGFGDNRMGLLVVVVFILWMMQMQYQMYADNKYLKQDLYQLKSMLLELESQRLAEEKLLRAEWKEWKTTLVNLEQNRIAEAKALRSDLGDWRSSFQEHETSRSSEAQSFWKELLEWRSSITSSKETNHPQGETESDPTEDDIRHTVAGSSIPRAGALGDPLKVESVHDNGRFPHSGQKTPSIEEINDWEKLEECTDCY